MTYKTHIASNSVMLFSLAALTAYIPFSTNTFLIACGSVVGSLAPDIDNPRSKINYILNKGKLYCGSAQSYDHRKNPPHWPLFAFVVILPFFLEAGNCRAFAIGAAIGVATHLLCDMFNPQGIMLLAPFSKTRFRFAKIPTGSRAEIRFRSICLIVCFFLLIIYIIRIVINMPLYRQILLS